MNKIKKNLLIFLFIILWNVFGLTISKNHIAPNFIIWLTGFMTCGFIIEWYLLRKEGKLD
ncbi:hypothetical protein [Clostridium botulinum]|uniref:hypothetical protein n=1 Tax=Clostridium botulinum TaxID=1491 RepID=UPI000773EB49|nr:hypothetical protein [Clostridium botulinum]MBN3351906.1 hypothetical protein [Clostridium botulinum]MBN3371754.1 hypothetical protein [Clostridium botulinum]MBN3451380.1 hypothetical protein [Clostridium botulinum]MBY6842712.1 hypothetical protein [Clostridium botulinum]NFB64637.1 hypothetical protein [Clostridium botulinum]